MKKASEMLKVEVTLSYRSPDDFKAGKFTSDYELRFDRTASPSEFAVAVAALAERGFAFNFSRHDGYPRINLNTWSNEVTLPELETILLRCGFETETKPRINYKYNDITEEYLAGKWVEPEEEKKEVAS